MNLVDTGAGSSQKVVLSLSSGSIDLTGTLTVAAIGGIATFSDIGVTTTGADKFLIAKLASTPTVSATSTLPLSVHGSAHHISFTTQASGCQVGVVVRHSQSSLSKTSRIAQ